MPGQSRCQASHFCDRLIYLLIYLNTAVREAAAKGDMQRFPGFPARAGRWSAYNLSMSASFQPARRYAAYAAHPVANQIATLFAQRADIRLAYLFGSLARGTATPASDADVAISLGRPMSASAKMQIIGDVGALLGRPVDLIDLETANGTLLGRIFKEGIRLIDDVAVRERVAASRANWQTDVAPYVERLRAERRAAWLGRG